MRTASNTLTRKVNARTRSRSSMYARSGNTVNENMASVKDPKGKVFDHVRLSSAAESFDNIAY